VDEILEKLEAWRGQGSDVAVATVVKTSGSTPRGEGAKLLVRGDGEMAGSVSGGCVETDVALHAQEVLQAGQPRLVSYGISDEMGISVGLACGGSIEVLIEPSGTSSPQPSSTAVGEGDLRAISDLVRHEVPVAIGTVIRPESMVGRRVWFARGEIHGSFGDNALDGAFVASAERLLRSGQAKAQTARDATGNEVELFVDTYPAPPTLLIFGGVHVGIPLTKYAKILGYRVQVIDPRGVFATRERFAEADDLLIERPEDYLARTEINENTYVVVLTHDPKFDEPVLKHVLNTRASYVGAIGSRKTNQDRMARLETEGVSRELLARIHSPIGLDIGSQVPEEIALAIMAEVVAARYGKAGTPLRETAGAFATVG
jgi:xanthine dehydrogenase accessory factor